MGFELNDEKVQRKYMYCTFFQKYKKVHVLSKYMYFESTCTFFSRICTFENFHCDFIIVCFQNFDFAAALVTRNFATASAPQGIFSTTFARRMAAPPLFLVSPATARAATFFVLWRGPRRRLLGRALKFLAAVGSGLLSSPPVTCVATSMSASSPAPGARPAVEANQGARPQERLLETNLHRREAISS